MVKTCSFLLGKGQLSSAACSTSLWWTKITSLPVVFTFNCSVWGPLLNILVWPVLLIFLSFIESNQSSSLVNISIKLSKARPFILIQTLAASSWVIALAFQPVSWTSDPILSLSWPSTVQFHCLIDTWQSNFQHLKIFKSNFLFWLRVYKKTGFIYISKFYHFEIKFSLVMLSYCFLNSLLQFPSHHPWILTSQAVSCFLDCFIYTEIVPLNVKMFPGKTMLPLLFQSCTF